MEELVVLIVGGLLTALLAGIKLTFALAWMSWFWIFVPLGICIFLIIGEDILTDF